MTDDNKFAEAVQKFREASLLISEAAALVDGDVNEAMDGMERLSPEVLGQLVMQHLPIDPHMTRMTPEMKRFWMAVGEQMGPDWVDAWRHVGGFMKKVDEF